MTNYTINVSEVIKLNSGVTATVTRDPLIWKVLLPWVLTALTLFLIFQHFLIKFIEQVVEKDKNKWRSLIISILSLLILILMISFAVQYGPVDLLRPISKAFGIEV